MSERWTSRGASAALRHTVMFPNGPPAKVRARARASRERRAGDDEEPTGRRGVETTLPGKRGAAERQGTRPDEVAAGSIIGSYRVLEELADGGMGVVYLGEHLHLGRKVALKFLHQKFLRDGWAVSRFFAEAVAASRVSHPGTVSVFDYGTFAGGAYIVMEYLGGETLGARLERERRLPVPLVIDIGVQLARTLGAAHEAGVIHRDLKPENVHLVPHPDGCGTEYVKLLDFGVAKLTDGSCAPQTHRGDLLGTPFYMAPEQSLNAGTVDHRCDIYSLGCLLYHLVTGTVPFRGSMIEILVSHQNQPPAPPHSFDPAIPPALDALILRMMSKYADQRPASMGEVVRALSAAQEVERPAPPVRRRPRVRWTALLLGLCFALGLAIASFGHLATMW